MSDDGLKDLGKDRTGKRWWRARLYWTDPLTGEPRETKRKFHAASRGLALQKRDELTEELRSGEKPPERKRFKEVIRERVAAITVHATRLSNESFERTLNKHFGEMWFDAITRDMVQDYLDDLVVGPGACNNLRGALIVTYEHAMKAKLVKENFAAQTSRRCEPVKAFDPDADDDEQEEIHLALEPEEIALYFDDLEDNDPDLYPLVHTQFMMGCRYSEVTALRRARLDVEAGIVKVSRSQYRGVAGHTKNKEPRKLGLPLESRALLAKHLARMEVEQWPGWRELVFPRPLTGRKRASNYWPSSTVIERIRASFERTGIVVKGKTHVARHTMITQSQDVTPSARLLQEVAGHRSRTAHRKYVHPTDAQVIVLGEAAGKRLLSGRQKK